MPASLSAQRLRGFMAVYLAVVAGVTAAFALSAMRSAHPWIMGEWLINDAGGFVRRGLPGSALLWLSGVIGVPLLPLLSAVQLLVYGAWYAGVFALTRGVRWSLPLLAALVSPATLAFTVLDPPSSVRKEALFFVSLALLLLLLRSDAVTASRKWVVWLGLLVAAPVLALVHEGLLPFLPYLFAPLFLVWPRRAALRLAAVPAVAAMLAAAAVLNHPGDRAHAAAICAVLAQRLPATAGVRLDPGEPGGLCNGAIAYLGMTPAAARDETARAARVYHYGRIYPPAAALAFLPAAWLLARCLRQGQQDARRGARVVVVAALVSVALSVPLFVVARDWGRWIHIHATALMLLGLALEQTGDGQGRDLELPRQRPLLALLLLAVYAVGWTLPAVGIFPGRFGYVDLIRYMHGYKTKAHLAAHAS